MLQNARVTAFTVSELLRENQLGGKVTPPTPLTPTRIRVKLSYFFFVFFVFYFIYLWWFAWR